LSEIEVKIYESIAKMAKEEERRQDKKELTTQLEQFKKFTMDRLSDVDKLKKGYDKLEYEIYQRVSLVAFDKLNSYVNELPTYSQLLALQTQINLAIRDFTDQNLDFKSLFADNCNYVSRFDEVLSLKASKHSVLES